MNNQIKEKIIRNFIKNNSRAPTTQEITFEYNSYINNNPDIENTGLGVLPNQYFIAGNESSKDHFNDLLENTFLDQKHLLNNIKKQRSEIEYLFKSYFNKLNKSLSQLKKVERNVNKNILLYTKEDVFNYGIVESFENYDKVDFQRSNSAFYNGKATVGFKKISSDSFKPDEIFYSITSRSGVAVQTNEISSISNIEKEDGSFFKSIAKTRRKDDVLDFVIEINFKEEEGVNLETIKFVTQTPERNSKVSYKCYYSSNNSSYSPVFENNLRITNGENYIEVNKRNVKKVKIILTKYAYDYKENNDFTYVFSLDFLGYTKNLYKINKDSVLYLGPYEIVDEEGEAVNYSLATARGGTCCIVPDETSIDLYLSKNNINWLKIDFDSQSKEVIQFYKSEENAEDFTLFDLVDSGSLSSYLAETVPEEIVLKDKEKLLNLYVPASNVEHFVKNSLKIKRNTLQKGNTSIYDASKGWYRKDGFYYTTIEITQPEGRYLDFGNLSCFINNRIAFGKVFLNQGLHSFKTSTDHWNDLMIDDERTISSSRELKRIDNLYPYNHKYVVEGFNYSNIFRGKKVYTGADSCFGFLLSEISKERFQSNSELNKFYIQKTNSGLYFIINVDQESSDSKLEDFSISYRRTAENDSNLLYIKAILRTSNEEVTPKIDQIQVRVI